MRGWGYFCLAKIAGEAAGGLTGVEGDASSRSDWRTCCHRASRNPIDSDSGELVELGVIRMGATNVVVERSG